jgi:hypothetical protein
MTLALLAVTWSELAFSISGRRASLSIGRATSLTAFTIAWCELTLRLCCPIELFAGRNMDLFNKIKELTVLIIDCMVRTVSQSVPLGPVLAKLTKNLCVASEKKGRLRVNGLWG